VGEYYYRVKASNIAGDSDWSDIESVTVTVIPPAAPVLDPISNPDEVNHYTVSWSAVSGATNYTLEEDDNGDFTSPETVYSASGTSTEITVPAAGEYYYRVKASNIAGDSDWSNTEQVTVSETGPEPGYYTGSPSVSFDVTPDQQVCDFRITVPFVTGSCQIAALWCEDIVDGSFSFSHADIANIFSIDGVFDTSTDVTGDYFVSICDGTVSIPPSEGTWSASYNSPLADDPPLDQMDSTESTTMTVGEVGSYYHRGQAFYRASAWDALVGWVDRPNLELLQAPPLGNHIRN
jgi:hypothetical protein